MEAVCCSETSTFTYTLMMEVVCAFETLVNAYQTTQCHNPEEHNLEVLQFEVFKEL
jgi:hypothetical protein